jgi:hypothetical protein
MLKKLLAEETLDQPRFPNEVPSALMLDVVRDQLGSYFANISEESWKWSENIDALLGAFHWPESYRERVKDVVQHIVEQPEHYKQLFALEERFANLANESEDSPEVERLAEDYARSGEVGQLQAMFSTNNAMGSSQLENVFLDLTTTLVSPAQRRFFEEVSRKLNSSESKDYQIKLPGQS